MSNTADHALAYIRQRRPKVATWVIHAILYKASKIHLRDWGRPICEFRANPYLPHAVTEQEVIEPDLDEFSDSEIECLEAAISEPLGSTDDTATRKTRAGEVISVEEIARTLQPLKRNVSK